MSGTPLARDAAEAWRLRAAGVLYLVLVAALVWVSVASYRHVFSDDVTVTVDARAVGDQLNVGGDVRMNGAIVGRVSDVAREDGRARVELQVRRDAAERIPADVVARILPTTLFGQKYVELRSSARPGEDHLRAGDVIAEDRSAEAVELTGVLDELDRVLRTVQPDRLATTLSALADGLDGRGKRIGRLADRAGRYLQALNADMPLLEQDLELLGSVAGEYADAAPDLLATAEHATVTARTLTGREGAWGDLLTALTGASVEGRTLLEAHRRRIAETAALSRPTLELLADYSPQLACNIEGFLAVEAQSADQIRDGSFQGHFTMGAQAGGYTEEDRLELGELGTGPHCRGLPEAPVPYPAVDVESGVEDATLAEILLPGGAR